MRLLSILFILVSSVLSSAAAQGVVFAPAGFNDSSHKILNTTIKPPGEFILAGVTPQTPVRSLSPLQSPVVSFSSFPSSIGPATSLQALQVPVIASSSSLVGLRPFNLPMTTVIAPPFVPFNSSPMFQPAFGQPTVFIVPGLSR